MKFITSSTPPSKAVNAISLVGVFEDGLSESAKELNKATKGAIDNLLKSGVFQGKIGQVLPFFTETGQQILLVGCGKSAQISPSLYRRIIWWSIKLLSSAKIKLINCYLSEIKVDKKTLAWKFKQIVEVTNAALYRFDRFKSEKEAMPVFDTFAISLHDNKQVRACERAIKQGLAVSNGIELTKNLANLPSNYCTPTFIADEAKRLAKSFPALSVKVLGEKEMKKLGMGALLGVSQGSAEEGKLICLEYKGDKKKSAPYALVGKGVTFDTGGISLKPADSMVGMKYDMCGAATVLGTLKAACELKLPINIVGIIPTVENMPDGTAYKPEDILTSMSGQTIEVISTDAEGRLILADALTYVERYKPQVVIDIATLTGAVVIALGFHATGLVSNDEKLSQDLLDAGIESHDRAWPLPMWEEYQEQIRSPFADIANTGGRPGGTITAGCFLSRFAKNYKWAHLDVAGTAAMMSGTQERLATGRPVAMLTQYLINQAES